MNSELLDTIEYSEEHVDVEAIMRQIREYLAQKHGTRARTPVEIPSSTVFDAEVYDELYEATQTFDGLYVAPYLTPVRVPLLGTIWQRLRAKLHELVVFYVNRLAEAQMRFNTHVVRVLDGMVRSVDEETPDRIRHLERRVKVLEERLRVLESGTAAPESDADDDGD